MFIKFVEVYRAQEPKNRSQVLSKYAQNLKKNLQIQTSQTHHWIGVRTYAEVDRNSSKRFSKRLRRCSDAVRQIGSGWLDSVRTRSINVIGWFFQRRETIDWELLWPGQALVNHKLLYKRQTFIVLIIEDRERQTATNCNHPKSFLQNLWDSLRKRISKADHRLNSKKFLSLSSPLLKVQPALEPPQCDLKSIGGSMSVD